MKQHKEQLVKKLLKRSDLTYDDFARSIGKSKATVINYFNGRSKIDIDTIERIAEVFEVPVSVFFEEGGVTNNANGSISNSNVFQAKKIREASAGQTKAAGGETIEKIQYEKQLLEQSNQALQKEIDYLKEMLNQKDEILKQKDEMLKYKDDVIEMYKKQAGE